jgi:hypothetical protein
VAPVVDRLRVDLGAALVPLAHGIEHERAGSIRHGFDPQRAPRDGAEHCGLRDGGAARAHAQRLEHFTRRGPPRVNDRVAGSGRAHRDQADLVRRGRRARNRGQRLAATRQRNHLEPALRGASALRRPDHQPGILAHAEVRPVSDARHPRELAAMQHGRRARQDRLARGFSRDGDRDGCSGGALP